MKEIIKSAKNISRLYNSPETRKEFNNEVDRKTKEYQKKYGFEISDDPKHPTWNNEADAFKHAYMSTIEILSDYAQNDDDIAKNIKFCLTKDKDSVAYAKELIQNSIKQAKGRYSYIDYDKMSLAVSGPYKALKLAEQELKNDNSDTATDICLIIIDKINKMIYNCDDSNGEISSCLGKTLDLLEQIAYKPNNKIFDKIYKIISSKKDLYDDVFFDLLDIASRLCSSQETKNKIKNLISQKIEQNKDQKFALQKYQELFYNFLSTYEWYPYIETNSQVHFLQKYPCAKSHDV